MSFSNDIPEICIISDYGGNGGGSSDENADDTFEMKTSESGLSVKENLKDGLTDVEDLSDSGQEENDMIDQIDNLTLDENDSLRVNKNDDDIDRCLTDVECYDKSDDEDDVSDYYSESDILVNNYFDNAIQEDQVVTKDVDNDDEDILEEQKRKKAEFYAKKREKKAKRAAAKLFQSSTGPVTKMDSGSGLTDVETIGSDDDNETETGSSLYLNVNATKNYAVTDVESLENSGEEDAATDENDDQFDLPLPEVACDKIVISDNMCNSSSVMPSINIESFDPIQESKESSDDDENASGFLTDVMNVSDEDVNNLGSGVEFDYEYPNDVLKPFENNSVDCQSSMLEKDFNEIVDN